MNKRNELILVTILATIVILGCARLTGVTEETAPAADSAQAPSAPISGMTKFETDDIEIWLPDTYVGGDIREDMDVILENLRKQGPDFENIAKVIEQNPDMYVIWATDSAIGPSGMMSSVTITTEKVISTITLDMYLDAAENQFPPQFQIVERELVDVAGYDAGKLVIEFEMSGVSGKEILYVIKDDKTMWIITFGTGADEFDERLPEFEKSASSFRVKSR
jgi:serine/threonine-protein kinase